MKRQWKNIDNTRRPTLMHQWGRWLLDKDNRAVLLWIGALLGIGFVFLYQMTLDVGFTPQVSLAEGTFVLGKAALIGLLFFSAVYAGVFAPAASLTMLGVDVDKVRYQQGGAGVRGLLRRCLGAQAFGGFFLTSFVLFKVAALPYHFGFGVASGAACLIGAVVAMRSPRLPEERASGFGFSLFVIAFVAAFSFLMFVMIANVRDGVAPLFAALIAWFGLTLVSAILSIVRRKDLLPSAVAALLVLAAILSALGQLQWPFRAIANSVGIAQRGLVTLIVPEASCQQLRRALASVREISCSGDDAGIVRDVDVLNDWGARWLIRVVQNGRGRTLSYDGGGTVISLEDKDSKISNNNKDMEK